MRLFQRLCYRRSRASQLLIAGIFASPCHLATAQEITKPRPPALPDRLPAPAQIGAAQTIDGSIRVWWSPVEGAVSYKLFRSVPPAVTTEVPLPNPLNTAYTDLDVKTGSTYYYMVHGVSGSGMAGLKIAAQPVKAEGIPVATDPKQIYSWLAGTIGLQYGGQAAFSPDNQYNLKGASSLRWFSQDESIVSIQPLSNGGALATAHNKPGLVYVGVTAMTGDSTGLRTGVWRIVVKQ
jgi:hypothetical protein